ncbi:MAG: Ig-like domain-containing protein, partial [Turneriella sp.]
TLAVIQPAVDLAGSTTYKIRVTTAARDTAGNPLVAVYTTPTGFTTVVVPPTTLLGDALWARTTAPGTTDITSFSGAAADNSGVYVVSTLNAGTYNFGPGVSVTISSWACGVIVKYDHAGVAQWAKVPIATQRSTSFAKVVSDNAGSVYVVGYQAGSGTNDFGGGVSVTTTGLHPNALLLKYDSNGNAIWGRTINPGSPYDVQSGYGAAHVSADGSVYVGGYYSSPFPPIGATLSPTVSLPAVSGSRTLVVKYDADGNALWVRPAETGNSNYVSGIGSITTDGLGGVYAAGSQGGNSIISYGAGITITTDNGGTSSSLLLKYDTEGNILWARVAVPPALSSNASSTFTSVKTDSAGNVYLTGTQRGLLSFNYGNGVSGTAPYFANNAVLVKYDSNGSAQWLRTASVAPLNSFFMDLVIPSDTEIYAVGYQQNNENYSYGNALNVAGPSATAFNAVFLRFNEQGNLLAAKTLVSAPDHSVYYSIAFTGSAFYLVGSQTYGGLYDFGNAVTTLGGYVAGGNGLIVKYQR